MADFTYRSRPRAIEAVRWNGKRLDAVPQWLADAIDRGAMKTNGVFRCGSDIDVFTADMGILTAKPGDWLTCDSAGNLGVCKDAVFTALYEQAGAAVAQSGLLDALRLIANTDPVDAALDPQRAVRVAIAALACASVPQPVPAHIVREAERAIAAAEKPEGMAVHDGKAVILASHLRYLLAVAKGAQA